jgi:glycosidase
MNKSLQIVGKVLAVFVTLLVVAGPAAHAQTPAPSAARVVPEWLRRSVAYQIFPRNFSAQGDFNAITARLDELHDFGVDILWLMPIHPIGQERKKGSLGSPYSVRDFYAINPDYGTAADLKRLVQEAHQRGMKVALDIAAGHTSWDCVLMEHPEFYQKDDQGRIVSPNPAWTDVAALDYDNQGLRRYMIDVLKYWVREFDVDGFRCDVAFTVPTDFWETARAELASMNPDVIMFADASAKPELLSKAFDMDNSWPLLYAVSRAINGLSTAEFVVKSWQNTRQQFPAGALHMRFSDSQHEVRAVARFGIQGALAAQVMMLGLDGVPLFYNGMEVGDAAESADPALFEKLPVFWQPGGRPALREIYRDLIKLRKASPAFWTDEVTWLTNDVSDRVVSFMRQEDKQAFVMLVSFSNQPVKGTLALSDPAGFEPVSIRGMPEPSKNPLPEFQLGAYDWQIYQRVASK